jgi:hypothetical protein
VNLNLSKTNDKNLRQVFQIYKFLENYDCQLTFNADLLDDKKSQGSLKYKNGLHCYNQIFIDGIDVK